MNYKTQQIIHRVTKDISAPTRWRDVPRPSQAELAAKAEADKQQYWANLRAKAKCKTCCDMGALRLDLPLGHPDFGKPVLCPDCRADDKLKRMYERSQLTGWLTTATFDSFVAKHSEYHEGLEAAKVLAAKRTGWLTMYGNVGNGKTHLCAAIVNTCIDAGVEATYWTAADLLDDLRRSYKREDFDRTFDLFRNIKILVIDELDKANFSKDDKGKEYKWAKEKMYQLFDARYRYIESHATIFSMNNHPTEMLGTSDGVSDYLYSRMQDERAQVVHFAGKDKRPISKKLQTYAQNVVKAIAGR